MSEAPAPGPGLGPGPELDRRPQRPLVRAAFFAPGGLACVLALAALLVYVRSEQVLERRHPRPAAARLVDASGPVERVIARDPGSSPAVGSASSDGELLERGRHLVTVVAQCTYCHGPDLGGREMADDPWIGRLHASNLTRGAGGIGLRYARADWEAALRRGIDPQGRSLLLMPSAHLAHLSPRDLAAIVAYVAQVPPIDRQAPARRVGWLTRVVVALGLAPDLLSAEQVEQAEQQQAGRSATRAAGMGAASRVLVSDRDPIRDGERARTLANGEYLAEIGSCRVCHRADLAGGLHPLSLPGEPVPPDLTPGGPLDRWGRDDFARAMRDGQTPDGRTLDRAFMPWPAFAALTDDEIDALWRYLRTLDGRAGRSRDDGPRIARQGDGRSSG